MRTTLTFFALFTLFASTLANGQPDRDSLIEAWEAHVRMLPGTESLEANGDGMYSLTDTDLPYEGPLKIVGVLVRPAESAGLETDFSHTGMVEFELVDLPADRLTSQVYYYWLADRQNMYFSVSDQRWINTAAYQASLSEMYTSDFSWGPLSFMLNYGIWVALLGLLVIVFVTLSRQSRKARSLMDESAAINQKASDNLDRAKSMQDELLAISRETRDLQAENNALLTQMLEALKR